jgi:hypothetical protein
MFSGIVAFVEMGFRKVLRKEGRCRRSTVLAYEVDCEVEEAKYTMKQRMQVANNEACERRQ